MGNVRGNVRSVDCELRDRAIQWLTSPNNGPVLPDGGVLSWVNPKHEGYRYPEAAAWLLALLTEEDGPPDLRGKMAAALERSVSSNGSCGRNGYGYVFDTAIVYSALQKHAASGGKLIDATVLPRLLEFVSRKIRQQLSVWPSGGLNGAWSAQYGCHLLRVAGILAATGERELASKVFNDLIRLEHAGRFRNHARTDTTYLHAHCYATQGLLMLGEGGIDQAYEIAERSAHWLAGVLNDDGGIPAWYHLGQTTGPSRGDATAQAVRIWSAIDQTAFADSIDCGMRFLASLQTQSGGLRYDIESNDVNTWVTTFTVQALR